MVGAAPRGISPAISSKYWHAVDGLELEAVAAELAHDERLRVMPPTESAVEWLKPVATLSHH